MGVRTRLSGGPTSGSRGSTAAPSASGRLGYSRYLLAAVVVLVAAYVVTRVLGSSDDAGDDPLDRTTDAMGDERSRPGSEEQDRAGDLVTIPIKEPRSDDSAADAEPSTDTNERDDATDEDVSEE